MKRRLATERPEQSQHASSSADGGEERKGITGQRHTFALKRVQLIEKRWNVDNDAGTNEGITVRVDQTCRPIVNRFSTTRLESAGNKDSPLGRRLNA